MNPAVLSQIAVLTLTNPAEAARRLLDLRPGREVVWLAFFLAVVLNGAIQIGIEQMVPVPQGEPLPVSDPVILNLLRSSGAMLLSVVALLFVGRTIGGVATFKDILILTIWLQFLQIAAMSVTLIVSMVVPFMMVMFLLATALVSLYVSMHFLNEAHKFNSMLKSFGVILLSALISISFVLMFTPSGPV